jgi:hypothetical protein
VSGAFAGLEAEDMAAPFYIQRQIQKEKDK